eukprot:CAMPEP_0196725312 /NCGR_PEP_ID=MMETSP1091-20130531/6919_1 /TAXON_ID=302021 /ORGANISM="Rhodomonas sp., Strain CCMP768" /LENGTH=177 /DNA_ID=CAMNT_0042067573 /DNA_START=19 /DNA_END=552 /DNA_ORIENTATION=-
MADVAALCLSDQDGSQCIVLDDSDDEVVIDEGRSAPTDDVVVPFPRRAFALPSRPIIRRQRSNHAGEGGLDVHDGGNRANAPEDDVVFVMGSQGVGARVGAKRLPVEEEAPKGELPTMVECTICLNPVTKPTLTKCGHIFCAGCVRPWLLEHKKCPHCRARAFVKDLRPIFAMTDQT